jgi:hypothetical protein
VFDMRGEIMCVSASVINWSRSLPPPRNSGKAVPEVMGLPRLLAEFKLAESAVYRAKKVSADEKLWSNRICP